MATLRVHEATPDNAPELARLLDLFDHMGATPEQVDRERARIHAELS